MSSYFDKANHEIHADFGRIKDVEARVIRDCELVAGDKDCPEEFRKKIVEIISIYGYALPEKNPLFSSLGRNESDCMKRSALVMRLHDLFHEIAAARIETRFGMLNDKPSHILAMRDAYVKEKFE